MSVKYHVYPCTSAVINTQLSQQVCRLAFHCSVLLSMLTPLLSSCYCCWGCFPHPRPGVVMNTHKYIKSTHMSTCPQACKHTQTHTHTHTHTHRQGTIWLSAACPPAQPTQLHGTHSPEGELTFRQITLTSISQTNSLKSRNTQYGGPEVEWLFNTTVH